MMNSKRTKPTELKRAKEFFQRELDEYVTKGCFRPGARTRKDGPGDEVTDRYGAASGPQQKVMTSSKRKHKLYKLANMNEETHRLIEPILDKYKKEGEL
jgi:hypothetical protein